MSGLSVLTYYRGIAVPIARVDEVIQNIYKKGMYVGQGRWVLVVPDLRGTNLSELVRNLELNITITRKKVVETFAATGDYDTALFYACKHNQTKENTEGIIIEFNASLDRVFIDGRDFLYTVFQGYDYRKKSEIHKRTIKCILTKIYGLSIIPYVDEVFKTPHENQNRRIALVDVLVNDKRCVIAHKKNKMWINGRYGTWFRHSFFDRRKNSAR